MNLEIFKSSYGYYNLRTNDGRPTEEMVNYLKENGYRWSPKNKCWYPATSDAKEANLHDDFVVKFREKFFESDLANSSTKNQSEQSQSVQNEKSFGQELIEREEHKTQWRDAHGLNKNFESSEKSEESMVEKLVDHATDYVLEKQVLKNLSDNIEEKIAKERTVKLEELIAELREQLRLQNEKIAQLESSNHKLAEELQSKNEKSSSVQVENNDSTIEKIQSLTYEQFQDIAFSKYNLPISDSIADTVIYTITSNDCNLYEKDGKFIIRAVDESSENDILLTAEDVLQQVQKTLEHWQEENNLSEHENERLNEIKEINEKIKIDNKKNDIPNLKTYHTLKEDEIKSLSEITQDEFNSIIDALYQQPNPDYKAIPPIIKLPQMNEKLAKKIGVENANFFMKSEVAHVRPQRKGSYAQSLRIDEMKGMLDFIKTCETAYIDSNVEHQNFILAGLDSQDATRSNKIVFNKDEYGNYIVTVGKVDTFNLEESRYSKVAVGVEPTIWMEFNAPSSATMLRPSTTSLDDLNIAQEEKKSSKVAQPEHRTKKQLTEIREKCHEILEKLDNSYLNEKEKSYLKNEIGEKDENDRNWVEATLRSTKFIYCTKKDKDGYWDVEHGKEITANEARKMLSMSDFVSALDRACFHWTSGRSVVGKDGKETGYIFFDDSDRDRTVPPYELTKEDLQILSQYEGAGGLNEANRSVNGVLNEFYTPQNLVDKVWEIVDHYAPEAKTVLEPSSGIGKFAVNRPQNEFTMHELDETSARINKILHPNANVIQGAYQKQFFDESERFRKTDFEQPKYDVVIGNPPYGKYNDKYKGLGEGKEFDRYEEYFIAKGLDALKDENSVLAFVVPSGFLKSANDNQKKILSQKGELIDAYRLPEGTFGTTDVGTDIIVMRSWEKERNELQKNRNSSGHVLTTAEALKAEQRGHSDLLSDNLWFKTHPEKILGKTVEFTDRFGKPATKVVTEEGMTVQDELDKIDGFVASANYENALNKVSSGLEAYANGKISKSELDELSKEYAETAGVLGKYAEKNQVQSLTLPENTVDLTDAFDGKLKSQAEIAKYIKSISDEVFVTYDNYKIGILPKDSKHIVYTNGTPYRSQKIRMNNYLVNLEEILKNAKLKGVSDAKDKKDVKEFYYFEVPVKVGNGLYTVQFDCKKNSDVVIAKEQSSNKLTDNNIAEINPKEIFEINQVDCFLYNLKERVVTRNLSQEKKQELNQNRSWSNIAERAEGNGWNDVEVADYNKARNQISEYAKDVFEIDLEKSEIPEEAIDEFVKNHKEISFDKDLNLVIDDSLVKPENFSSREISNICEKKYGFYFEYENHENLADVYSKDGDLVGSYHDGRFGYAGPNLKVQIPDDYARQIIDFADKYLQTAQKENSVERRNFGDDYEMSEKEFANFTNSLQHEEEDFLQGKDQEDDELASGWANEDFERTQRLNEIISEIKKSDFKMKVSVENNLRKVVLFDKNGTQVFKAEETGNIIMPTETTLAGWSKETADEQKLAYDYFEIIHEDGVRGGDYVNKVFEKEEKPNLKTYHELNKDDIEGLSEVTQEEFNSIIDALYQQPNPNYRTIPSIIKLPQMNSELAKKISVENANFFMRSEIAHVRPHRKGNYDQSLRIDEMKGMLDFIKTCNTAYIDSDEKHQNFMLAGLDSKDNSRSNKIVFNKDEYGNYIVTVGKVKTEDLNEKQYSKVAVGVEPTIWRSLEENPSATMLRPSTTSLDDLNIAQKAEKSSEPVYFNNLSKEQQEEVIEGYRAADDQEMLETWQDELIDKYIKEHKLNNSDLDNSIIQKETDVAQNPPTDEWIGEYLQKNKVNFNTEYWQDIFAEIEQNTNNQEDVSPEEIEKEKQLIQEKILQQKKELNNPANAQEFAAYPESKQEIQDYIEKLENLSDDDIKNQIIWKKKNLKEKKELRNNVAEQIISENQKKNIPQNGELLSYNEIHPTYTLTNKETKRQTTIQPTGKLSENIKKLGKLNNLTEANNVIEKIKSSGFDILSTTSRVVIYNDDKYYDFDSEPLGMFNIETKSFEYDFYSKKLNEWDFKKYIDGGLKITKSMKEFERNSAENEKKPALNEKDKATNFVLEKLKSAGIEVVTDEDEFNRILEREKYLQMRSVTLTPEEQKRYFTFNDEEAKLYKNPDFLNSNVAVHEYTHLWDEYTRRTNPELWQKGMNILKNTNYFAEVKNDPNYADIANDDNLVLSEVHARICGEMAQKILERIAKEDGEITRDKAIDWDKEIDQYIYENFESSRTLNDGREIKSTGYGAFGLVVDVNSIRSWFAQPMKDLMNEKDILLHQNGEQKTELQNKAIDDVNAVEKRHKNHKQQEITLTANEIFDTESVIPEAEYNTILEYAAGGEESNFYKQKIKDIASAVQNAPKLYETDTQDEHKIVLRYFHPTGTEAFITEIGENGEAFGFQCLNGDWQNAEWGYININELKNTPMMETDLYVQDGMTVERYLGKEHPEVFPEYAKLAEKAENTEQKIEPQTEIPKNFLKDVDEIERAIPENYEPLENLIMDKRLFAVALDYIKEATEENKGMNWYGTHWQSVIEEMAKTRNVSTDKIIDVFFKSYQEINKNAYLKALATEKEIEEKTNEFVNEWKAEYAKTEKTADVSNDIDNIEDSVKQNIETSRPLGKIKLVSEEEQLKNYGITAEAHAKYFVKSTAEFEQFADFDPITNLTCEEAVAKYKELQGKGVHCGIGVNIEGDRVFDDKNGNGATVLVRNNEGRDTLNIYGDSFVKNLKELNQHSFNVLVAFDSLYRTAKDAGLDVEDAPYISEKENELFGNLFSRNQQTKSALNEKTTATNFVLEKLKSAGIEVVTDKNEFERILKSADRLQKMTADLSELESLNQNIKNQQAEIQAEKAKSDNLAKEEKAVNEFNFDVFIKEIQKYQEVFPKNQSIKLEDLEYENGQYKNFELFIEKNEENHLTLFFKDKNIYDHNHTFDDEKNYFFDITENRFLQNNANNQFHLKEMQDVFEVSKDLLSKKNYISQIHEELKTRLESMQSRQADILENLIKENTEKKNLLGNKIDEIKILEKKEARTTIDNWLYEAEEKAPDLWNKDQDEVKHYFEGNDERKSIGVISAEAMQIFNGVDDYHLYADKSYLIDHYLNRHHDNRLFENIQNVLDNYSDIYFDTQQKSIGFVKKYGDLADCLFVKQEGSKIVLFASTYNQPEYRLHNKRYEKITPAREQEQNVVEVRHTSSTARQGLSDPAAGISTLNDVSLEGSTPLSQNPKGNTAVAISDVNDNALRYHTANILQLNRSIGQYQDNFSGEESQAVLKKLDEYLSKIQNSEPAVKADDFLKSIQGIMHIDDEKSKTVRHYVGERENNLRISNHSANAVHAKFRPNETSVVIRLSSTRFNPDKNSYLVEYVYNSKDLTKEKQAGIINGLKDWINTGDFTDKHFDREFYSPSKKEYLRHLNEEQKPLQKMSLSSDRENVYGFAYNGKIYLNPDFMNSNVAVHEYTHLWDEYTRRTNPELWQKGMNIFKDTKFFSEVKNDPNYADIANDDNLVLSEVHARICGEMAQKILERIAKEDGEITKDKAIDWNDEVFDYIYDEFGWGRNSAFAKEKMNGYVWSDYAQFLVTPIKDLMNGKDISLQQEKLQQETVAKSKGEVMTAEEFSHLYGKDFDEREFPIWKATDWQGNIDLSKLSDVEKAYLSESNNYVQKNFGEWTHKELFTTGDIYAKIEEQKTLFEKFGHNALFAENIKLLENAKKPELSMDHIHFGVKTSLAEEFTIPHIDADGNKVELNLQESFILWCQNTNLENQSWRKSIDFATANINREELGEEISFDDIVDYIDGRPVKAEAVRGWRTWNMSDEEKQAEKAERKKEADLKRQARSDIANKLFDRYLHEGLDESTRTKLEAEYNHRFNSYVIPDYSKLPLFVDGMSAYKGNEKFKLYDQQIKGISFLCNKGNGLLAYDVGVGKTAAGIVATVNQIQTGRSKRPLIVVPNQVYSKWYTDIKQLFPNVQVNDLYNFNKNSVEKFVDKDNPHKLNIPENSISLVTYEALKNITFTDESCENALYEDFSNLLSADFDGSDRENAQSADKIKGIIGSASHVKDSSYYFFEDCGFDNLTVDEAHNFKNLWVVPRPKKKGESNEYSGIPSGKPSARALKMYGMTQLVQRNNDDRNVFMLTATPFTNSPTEVYSMLSYIGRERLHEAGLKSLRSFFDEFAQTKQELGVTSKGEIDTKQVMKNWKELPALQSILTEFIDKVDGEEAGIIRPNKFTHVKPLDMSELQKQMREIDEERMSEVKEGNSAAVIVAMNNMRLSCVAPALANPAMYPGVELPPLSQLVETSPKLKFVCDAIIDMYKDNPEKGQFMYVPLGKESHGIIKDYLVAHGIPKDAVEIINGEINNTPEKKEKITNKFNDEKDKLKIIIGGRNTSEGIDLNGNSFVMYNCSLGWNPSETIQAEGRIWRQGNLQGNVHIVYPVMNDSIDSVLYQKHDEKRSRINELWNYKGDSLNVEDINPEDLKLDLIKDPNKKAKLILQEETKDARAELSKINLKIKSFDDIIEKRKQLTFDFDNSLEQIKHYEKMIQDYKNTNLEVPEWIKSTLKSYKKEHEKSVNQKDAVTNKLSSINLKTPEDEAEYIKKLNIQKHTCEDKIKNIENTLPEVLQKLQRERIKQKLTEYPIEKQREILEADILNNLRPMKEVEYEIKTVRFENMLAEKLKSGDITKKEYDLYQSVGYEKYEKWRTGEIESLEENKTTESVPTVEQKNKDERHVAHENEIEKKQKVEQPVISPIVNCSENKTKDNTSVQKSKENSSLKSIYEDKSSLFFGMTDEEFVVASTKNSYVKLSKKSFAEQVDAVLDGTHDRFNALKVSDTPQILLNVGCKQLPILYTQKHLKDAIHEKSPENPAWHGLSAEQIKKIPDLLAKPAILMDSLSETNKDCIIAVLNAVDNEKSPLFAVIKPNGFGTYEYELVDSNFMLSIYGKDNGFEKYIEDAVKQDKVLFWDKKESQELFSVLQLQLPQGLNVLDPNKILHQTNSLVNPNVVSSPYQQYFNFGNDDISLTTEQLTKSEQKRDEIIFPILNGKETGMYKAFNDFAKHGVFDVIGTKVELSDEGKISKNGWNQLHSAMNIYRSKEFETFRYVLVDKISGEINEQLALSSYMPNRCIASLPDNSTLKQVISRAEETDSFVIAVHNHPSGNITESANDIRTTDALVKTMTNNRGECRFAGHIILDHDAFNLFTPENGWNTKFDLENLGQNDELVNQKFVFANQKVLNSGELAKVATKINDVNNWNDDFVPVVFCNAESKVTGLKLYDKSFFNKSAIEIRNTLQFNGLEAGAINAFPVITEGFKNKLNGVGKIIFEEKLKNLVNENAFTDAVILDNSNYATTIAEKNNLKPGLAFENVYTAKTEVNATWETRINPNLFAEKSNEIQTQNEQIQPKKQLKIAVGMEY